MEQRVQCVLAIHSCTSVNIGSNYDREDIATRRGNPAHKGSLHLRMLAVQIFSSVSNLLIQCFHPGS